MKSNACLFVDWHQPLSISIFWGQFSDPERPCHALFALMLSRLPGPAGESTWVLSWMRGKLTSEDVLADICRGTNVDLMYVLQTLQDRCQQMRLVSEAIPRMVAALRAKGLRVVIATDNMDAFPRWTIPSPRRARCSMIFLCSFEQRALKRDVDQDGCSRFFADYWQRHHISWGESLLLDDGCKDFGASTRRLGIDCQHIEPGRGLVPAQQALLASFSWMRCAIMPVPFVAERCCC
jgi:hypothetical protein